MSYSAYDVMIGILLVATLLTLVAGKVSFNKLTLRAAYDEAHRKWGVQKLLFGEFYVPFKAEPHLGKPFFESQKEAENWIFNYLGQRLADQRKNYGANISFSHQNVRSKARRIEKADLPENG